MIALPLFVGCGEDSIPKSKTFRDPPTDPFEFPFFRRYLNDPDPSEFEEWTYIIRYTEKRHSKTPIVIEVRANRGETRVRALRFFKGVCEIDFEYSIKVAENEISPPLWAMQLPEGGRNSGPDGDRIGFEVFTAEQSRYISRWSPEVQAPEEGLESALGWARAWLEMSGLVSRREWGLNSAPTKTNHANPDRA